ncbi:O-antigen ligase [Halomonas sp. A11-A]|jgi:O-antigen ligase|uniref:O-antigen ligase family protein n=1 Tax=Halomonas sp. A11-A TaxID=2183985 RepID=UPI0011B3A56D|nr:O-antigen ligase family protein [Halomonas sp. A11-A]
MTTLLTPTAADRMSRLILLLVLALLVTTPLRVHALIGVLLLYALAYLVAHPEARRLTRQDGVILALLALYALSHLPVFVLDGYAWRYLSPGLHMLVLFPVYLMTRHVLSRRQASVAAYRAAMELGLCLGGAGAAVLAIYQTLILGHYKADGFLFHINFGYLVASLVLLGVALLPGARWPALVVAGVLGAFLATLLSISRGALFPLPLVLGLVWLINLRRWGGRRALLALGVALVLVTVSVLVVPLVQERLLYTWQEFSHIAAGNLAGSESSGGRLQLWIAAGEAFQARPLIGLTYAERELLNAQLVEAGRLTEWVNGVSRGHAHSQYFETLATGGLIGMLALLGYLVLPAGYFALAYLRHRDNALALAGFVVSTGFVLFCLTEVALQHEMIGTYYAYLLLTLFLLYRRSRVEATLAPAEAHAPPHASAHADPQTHTSTQEVPR